MVRKKRKFDRKKLKREKLIPLLPNIFTTGSLTLGLASVMTSLQVLILKITEGYTSELIYRKLWWAAAFIGIAIVLDNLDGRLARALGSESKFGISYDSLSDLVSFGVAPGILIYVWILMDSGKLGLMALLFYVVCVALRLARFNIQSDDIEKYNFTGLPSPMAAGLMFAPVMLFSEFYISPSAYTAWFYLIAAPVTGLIMVSDIPYKKLPRFRMRGNFNILVIAAIIITAIISNPAIMVTFIVYTYFSLGFVSYILKQIKEKRGIQEEEINLVEPNQ